MKVNRYRSGLVYHQKEFQLHALFSRVRVFFIKNRFEIAGVLKHTVILQGKIEKFDFFFGGGFQMCRINILRQVILVYMSS